MYSATLTGPRNFEWSIIPIPLPGPDEVRIRLEGCGICHSNLALWEGTPWAQYPTPYGSLGHEGWGIVDEVGEKVKEFHPGERVTGLTYHSFAEYDLARSNEILKVPPSLSHVPIPGEAFGCAMNIFERARIKKGETVAIIGIGFLGALLTLLAKEAGAKVIGISRRNYSLEIAKEMGADEIIQMKDDGLILSRVKEITNGNLFDCVIEAVGKQFSLDLATDIVSTYGRLIIAGYHQDGPRKVNVQAWNWKAIDVINAHERDSKIYLNGIQKALAKLEMNPEITKKLLTHSIHFKELKNAFELLERRPDGFLKAYIYF